MKNHKIKFYGSTGLEIIFKNHSQCEKEVSVDLYSQEIHGINTGSLGICTSDD